VKAVINAVTASVSGGKAFHEASAGLLRGLDWAREHLQGLDTDEKVSAILDRLEEPSAEQLLFFEGIAKLVPVALNGLIREALKTGLGNLPGAKMGRKAVQAADKITICDEVAKLTRSGCSLPIAKLRTGRNHGVTARTVSRIWRERAEYQMGLEPEQVQALLSTLLHPPPIAPAE
jgi:hypothetical protein